MVAPHSLERTATQQMYVGRERYAIYRYHLHSISLLSAQLRSCRIARCIGESASLAFLQQAYEHLSVALHAANASIAVGGLQRLRVSQLLSSGDLPMSPCLGGYRHADVPHVAICRCAPDTST